MSFFFLDESKVFITDYSYGDFKAIVEKHGYTEEKNISAHTFFNWPQIHHWSIDYNNEINKQKISIALTESVITKEPNFFLVRLLHDHPLIQVDSYNLINMLNEFMEEAADMGWEAISVNGKYILEYTDSVQHSFKCNFKIIL